MWMNPTSVINARSQSKYCLAGDMQETFRISKSTETGSGTVATYAGLGRKLGEGFGFGFSGRQCCKTDSRMKAVQLCEHI